MMSEKINFPAPLYALEITLATSLWDQLDGDSDLPLTECGGWRKYIDIAVETAGIPSIVDDICLLVGGRSRLGYTPSRKQREAAVERLRMAMFGEANDA